MTAPEPLWKKVLAWGCTLTYLTMPGVVFIIHMIMGRESVERLAHAFYLRDFYLSLTGMLVALAGLNSYQGVVHSKVAATTHPPLTEPPRPHA